MYRNWRTSLLVVVAMSLASAFAYASGPPVAVVAEQQVSDRVPVPDAVPVYEAGSVEMVKLQAERGSPGIFGLEGAPVLEFALYVVSAAQVASQARLQNRRTCQIAQKSKLARMLEYRLIGSLVAPGRAPPEAILV